MSYCFTCGQECSSEIEPCSSCKESLSANPGALADVIYGLQSEAKIYDAKITYLKGMLTDALVDPQTLHTDNGYRISYRQFPTNRLDFKLFRAEQPEVYAAYSNPSIVTQLYIDPIRPKF